MRQLVSLQSSNQIDISILRCVDCHGSELSDCGATIRYMSCRREYDIIDESIISILPSRISSVKKYELKARNRDSANYDRHRSDDLIESDKVSESGKQGFYLNNIHYYNFSLPELYVLLHQQTFKMLEYGLFFFELPVWARIFRKATRYNRIKLEKLLYSFLKSSAHRVYLCTSK